MNGRPLSDEARNGLKVLKPETLAEMAKLTPSGDTKPSGTSPWGPASGFLPGNDMKTNTAAPQPINIQKRIRESRKGA